MKNAQPTNHTSPGQPPTQPSAAPQQPTPPKMGRKDGLASSFTQAPENVRYGVWAWLCVSALQVLSAVVQYVANLADGRSLRQEAQRYLDEGPAFGPSINAESISVESLASMLNVSMAVLMVAATGICALLALRAGRGAVYSRMFLNVGSLYLGLSAVLLVFSSPPGTMPVGFALILGIVSILSGVVAVVGMWFMSRPDTREWFGVPSEAEVEKYREAMMRFREEEKQRKELKDHKEADKEQQR